MGNDRTNSKPIRVGLLTWALPPEKSGLSRAAWEIAQSVAEAGAVVRVFTLDRRGRTRDGDVEVIGCGIPENGWLAWLRRRAAAGHLAAPIAFRCAVAAEHEREPFDVIEATNWYAPGVLVSAAPLVTRNSTPATISLAQARTARNRIDGWAAAAIERRSARASAGLISNTAEHGRTIASLYDVAAPGDAHAVIGLSLPPAIVARGTAATYPGAGRVELLFVGRAEPRKGFDALKDALAILAAEDLPDYRMTLVGVREDEIADLPPAALARARFFHRVDDDHLHDLFEAAHIVVAPSRYESFGLVYQEAMMFGRPIVACAEDASARRFVGETGAGPLARDCSGPAVADALRPLLRDAAVRGHHAAASRAAAGRFTRATLGEETLRVYRSAIASKGRSSRASSSARAPSGASPA